MIGEEGQGFKLLLQGLNPERVLFAVEAIGLGRAAIAKAAQYAKERVVFGRPIGQNRASSTLWPNPGRSLRPPIFWLSRPPRFTTPAAIAGRRANASKYLGAEAGFHACETAVLVHGGMGYAKEYDVERYFREAMIARIAPVSREMILNFIAERVLGLPKSY